jgi:crotonobetainyl-CoA:carnitine CoA-transferase CaiB-like acyl-CoA transferase
VGVVTDTQWRQFCHAFELQDLLADPALATGPARTEARPRILSRVRSLFRTIPKAALMARLETLGLPFAPIARPADLFEDPHLLASGGLLPIDLARTEQEPARSTARLPALPVMLGGARTGLVRQPPILGEHTAEVARLAGLTDSQIQALIAEGVLVGATSEVVADSSHL